MTAILLFFYNRVLNSLPLRLAAAIEPFFQYHGGDKYSMTQRLVGNNWIRFSPRLKEEEEEEEVAGGVT